MSEQFIVEQLEILNDENDFKGEYWWAVTNTERIEDCFECRNKEVAIELCAFLNKATDDFKWQIRQSEKWSAKVKQLQKQVKSIETTMNATSDYNAHLESKITTLEKENEQLKKQLEIRTESDKYHQRMLKKWLCKDE